jgi:tRNA acetyltransferase TAN1
VSGSDDQEDEEDEPIDDIESSIQKEMVSMDKSSQHTKLIAPVRLDLQCVLFFKIRPPIDPVDFVHRICKEIVSTSGVRRMRYINRLTPMTLMGKATEKGLEEVGKAVLGQHFNLRENQEQAVENDGEGGRKAGAPKTPLSSVSVAVFRSSVSLLHRFWWQLPKLKPEILDDFNTNMRHSMQYGLLLAITIP